ncbi:hypothetical protein MTX78_02755 [Hymenobacter tibetensis]|uniref:Tetratricopeptide repeat protein n=1 Tax=Hymenobacter tibetensis TaxID=497967 RepID=A0ABY4D2T6_9BACT|nr:hypothetical protein [Hymenobacter tibetensis]UOG75524.1 hypothetical protein MTX78_02755 [Hymenobacter tibetensis]
MAEPANNTRRWVATLLAVLFAIQAGNWLWRTYRRLQGPTPQQVAEAALQRKIAASHAYDNQLLRANSLLDRQDTTAASHLLDSLRQQPTSGLFPIELQKLRTTTLRLDSVRSTATAP